MFRRLRYQRDHFDSIKLLNFSLGAWLINFRPYLNRCDGTSFLSIIISGFRLSFLKSE